MSGNRHEKMEEALREVVAEFLVREAGPQSLITVTRVILNDDGSKAQALITVLPDSREEEALNFANRQRSDLRAFFEKRVRGMRLPHIEFIIDRGEKNRQRLDELSQ
jgi:ribosome-binding factor A